jgi:hypothetical protein
MKICIELDSWMKKEWESAKKDLESDILRYSNEEVSLSDSKVVQGLLFCFDTEKTLAHQTMRKHFLLLLSSKQ